MTIVRLQDGTKTDAGKEMTRDKPDRENMRRSGSIFHVLLNRFSGQRSTLSFSMSRIRAAALPSP